jgi:hypothetical protein
VLRQLDMHALGVGRELVASHRELMAAGVGRSTIGARISPGGRWQRMHPGVVLMHRGRPTWREQVVAALSYAGPGSVLSGSAALRLHGLREGEAPHVLVLIPEHRRRQSHGPALLERTRRLPGAVDRQGLGVAPLGRAVVDACRRLEELNAVRNLVADAVQNHRLPVSVLASEIRAAARQRTALSRAVLAEIDTGVRFAAEARAREVLRERGLPEPLYNVEVLDDDGTIITIPDGYYPEWACGYQVDSRRWHLSPEAYEGTTRSRGYAGRYGIVLLSVTPVRVFEDPDGFVEDLRGVIRTAQARTPPALRVRSRRAA